MSVNSETGRLDDFLHSAEPPQCDGSPPIEQSHLCAILEASLFASPEPLAIRQLAIALQRTENEIQRLLDLLIGECQRTERGLMIRKVAGRYQMITKPEHHQQLCEITRQLRPRLSLSMPALQTLAIIAYKQPISGPEIQAIRKIRGAGVLNTLLKRKWIATVSRRKGPRQALLYKTTQLFLIEFGLQNLNELRSLQEFPPSPKSEAANLR